MRLQKVLTLNIIMSFLELAIVLFFTFKYGNITIQIFIISLYILLLLFQLIRGNKRNLFEEVKVENNQFENYIELINKTKEYKPNLQYKYVEYKNLPSPAFYFKDTVYINTAAKIEPEYFEGMLAHELGHATTKLGDYINNVALRLSTIFANMIFMLRVNIKTRNNILFKILDNILFSIYNILSIPDHLVLNRYVREDEFLANSYACKITDGRSLRTYYYKTHIRQDKYIIRYDFKHPSAKDMMYKMEQEMNITSYEQDVYAIKNRIFYIKNSDKNEKLIKTHNYYLHCTLHDKDISFKLARNFELGRGCDISINQAVAFYTKATNLLHEKAPYNLAEIYNKQENLDQAIKYYIIASKNNNKAFFKLGSIYEKLQNTNEAIAYYSQGNDYQSKRKVIELTKTIEEEPN